jgi:hypothetical protein
MHPLTIFGLNPLHVAFAIPGLVALACIVRTVRETLRVLSR